MSFNIASRMALPAYANFGYKAKAKNKQAAINAANEMLRLYPSQVSKVGVSQEGNDFYVVSNNLQIGVENEAGYIPAGTDYTLNRDKIIYTA